MELEHRGHRGTTEDIHPDLSEKVLGAKVHTTLGPGLLESAYEACLCHELARITYLRASGVRVGLLLNFNVSHLRNGIRRLVK